jgi:hypothetical protein
VLLRADAGGSFELDETVAERKDNRWVGLWSGGGTSDVIEVEDHRAAVLCNRDPLPPEVRQVVVRDRGVEHRVPVEGGYFLYVAWQQREVGSGAGSTSTGGR